MAKAKKNPFAKKGKEEEVDPKAKAGKKKANPFAKKK